MNKKFVFFLSLLIIFLGVMRKEGVRGQNLRLDWSAFSGGFAVPTSASTAALSSVTQSWVGRSQGDNRLLESGFLAHPLMQGIIVSVNQPEALPRTYVLRQNYPNPFNPSTEVEFVLPKTGWVKLKIYDLLGQEVKTLINERKAAGIYTVQWDGTDDRGQRLASGVYLYRLETGDFVKTRKMLLIK